MAGLKTNLKDANGNKLYAICGWHANQHKLYNAYDRACNRIDDGDHSDEAYDWMGKVEKALEAFDAHVYDNIVYGTWEMRSLIKDIIGGYDLRVGR